MSTFESSHIHKKTQKAIFDKISALNRETLGDNTTGNFFSANNTILESKQNPISQHIVRNCFARFSVDYAMESKDDNTELFAENISSFVSDERIGKNTQANRPLAFDKDPLNIDENYIWRGETGLTNIQVTQKSFFVNEITVSYTCPNPNDFEKRIKPKFLQLGNFAVIEFGWGIDNETFESEIPKQTMNSLAKLQNNLQTINERHAGSYQVYCGDITNYTFKVDENGYYSGTITIVSRGNNVLHSTIDNESSEDKPIADFKVLRNKEQIKELYRSTKDLNEVFKNQDNIKKALEANEITFKGVIEGLEDVVDNYLNGADTIDETDLGDAIRGVGEVIKLIGDEVIWETIKTYTIPIAEFFKEDGRPTEKFLELGKNQQQDFINGVFEAAYRFDESITFGIPTPGKVKNYTTAELQGVVKPFLKSQRVGADPYIANSSVSYKFYNGAMEYLGYETSPSEVEKRTIYPIGINDEKNKSRFLVSWGWFEDHILNSFFSIKNEYKNIKTGDTLEKQTLSFRSVHKPLLYEVQAKDREAFKTLRQHKDISETTPVDLGKFEKVKYSNRCNNSPSLKSLGLTSVILPGQTDLQSLKTYLNQDDGIILTAGEVENKTEAERLYKVFQTVDENFKNFGNPSEGYGYIRNMVFDVKYLKSHFLNITSVQDGIRSLFSDLNTKYGGFFNFMLKQDDENTGNIGVTDGYYLNPVEKSEELLKESRTNDYPRYLENKKELSDKSMFRFDLYTKNTIIKDFDLSLNLSDKAATMAYFNNAGFVGGGYYNPNQIKDLSIERFTALTSAEVFNKEFASADENIKLSELKNKNQNYVLNGVKIPVYSSGFTSEQNDKIGLGTEFDDERYGNVLFESEAKELIDNIGIDFRAPKIRKSVKEVENRLNSKRNEERKKNINVTSEPPKKPGPAPFSENGEYDPFLQQVMKNNANNSRDAGVQSNYKILKTIIPIDLNMTIDGVGGLRPGNLFRVDYLPKLYRKYCYFQIFTVSHQVNTSGWSTSITAKMKLDFPKLYRDKLIKIERNIEEDLFAAAREDIVSPNQFAALTGSLQEDIKELNEESYGWSGEETEIRHKIASDNTLIPSFNNLINSGASLQAVAKNYVERNLKGYLPNQMMQINYEKDYNDFISKYSKIVIDKYNGKKII